MQLLSAIGEVHSVPSGATLTVETITEEERRGLWFVDSWTNYPEVALARDIVLILRAMLEPDPAHVCTVPVCPCSAAL
jgi:hypothetical protein